MSEVKTVTPEELQQVKELQDAYLKTTFELGQISVDKREAYNKMDELEVAEKNAFQHLGTLRQKEQELSSLLQEKYGSSTIDLETGVIK